MIAMSRAAFVAASAVLLVSACSGESGEESAAQADQLSIADAWVKAADEGMTAGFGLVTNDGDADVTIVGAHSESTSQIQLHEVVDETMRQVDGGFVIPAGESLTLEPGGYHLMFMDVPEPIVAGEDVTITLELEDGSTFSFDAVVKDFSGGNEEYDGDMDMHDMSAEPSMGAE